MRSQFARRPRRLAVLAIIVLLVGGSLALLYHFYSPAGTGGEAPTALTLLSQPRIGRFVTEYPISGASLPNGIAADSSGEVWVVLGANSSIAELNPANGTVHEFPLPLGKNSSVLAWGVAVDDARRVVWFTDQVNNAVWSFDVASHSFAEYSLPAKDSSPFQIALDKEGDAWFTEASRGSIGEVTVERQLLEFPIPTKPFKLGSNLLTNNTGPAGITVGPDGTVWFAEAYAGEVGSFSAGRFRQFNLSGLVLAPTGISMDGLGNLWFTQHADSLISEFNPQTGSLRSISTSNIGTLISLPYFIHVDSRGIVWFNEHYGNAIGRFDPTSNRLVEYEVPSRPLPENISGAVTFALTSGGQPWFTEYYTGMVGTVEVGTPVKTQVTVLGVAGNVTIASGQRLTASASLETSDNTTRFAMSYAAGSYTRDNLSMSFTPAAGTGNFLSVLAITNNSSVRNPQDLWYTVSASSTDLVVSEVVLLDS